MSRWIFLVPALIISVSCQENGPIPSFLLKKLGRGEALSVSTLGWIEIEVGTTPLFLAAGIQIDQSWPFGHIHGIRGSNVVSEGRTDVTYVI